MVLPQPTRISTNKSYLVSATHSRVVRRGAVRPDKRSQTGPHSTVTWGKRTWLNKSPEALLPPKHAYSSFESRRRPKSATSYTPCKPIKSTTSFHSARSLPIHSARVPKSVPNTLTPKPVSPSLTQCRKHQEHRSHSSIHPEGFRSFTPKTTRSKDDHELEPGCSKPKEGAYRPNSRQGELRDSNRDVRESNSVPVTRSLRPKSAQDIFCNCPSGQSNMRRTYMMSSVDHFDKLLSLCGSYGLHWIQCRDGDLCSRAVEGGHTRSGEPLYIARAITPDRRKHLGMFLPSTGLCYLYRNDEWMVTDRYELLCYRSRIQSPAVISTDAHNLILADSLKVLTLRERRQTVSY